MGQAFDVVVKLSSGMLGFKSQLLDFLSSSLLMDTLKVADGDSSSWVHTTQVREPDSGIRSVLAPSQLL